MPGVGDRVLLVTEGFSAMTSVGRPESPIDMAVVGVIDRLDIDGGTAPAPARIRIRITAQSRETNQFSNFHDSVDGVKSANWPAAEALSRCAASESICGVTAEMLDRY